MLQNHDWLKNMTYGCCYIFILLVVICGCHTITKQSIEHRNCIHQKQLKCYWKQHVTVVNATIEVTDNYKQDENTTVMPHIL
jgi:hypothetical protein